MLGILVWQYPKYPTLQKIMCKFYKKNGVKFASTATHLLYAICHNVLLFYLPVLSHNGLNK